MALVAASIPRIRLRRPRQRSRSGENTVSRKVFSSVAVIGTFVAQLTTMTCTLSLWTFSITWSGVPSPRAS